MNAQPFEESPTLERMDSDTYSWRSSQVKVLLGVMDPVWSVRIWWWFLLKFSPLYQKNWNCVLFTGTHICRAWWGAEDQQGKVVPHPFGSHSVAFYVIRYLFISGTIWYLYLVQTIQTDSASDRRYNMFSTCCNPSCEAGIQEDTNKPVQNGAGYCFSHFGCYEEWIICMVPSVLDP